MTDSHVLIVDIGPSVCNVGFGTDEAPVLIFPNLVGRRKPHALNLEDRNYVGDETHHIKGLLDLQSSIENGIITNWIALERIFQYIFDKLNINPQTINIIITVSPQSSSSDINHLMELMFNKFHIKALYISNQAKVSLLYAQHYSNRTEYIDTGCIIDSGDKITTITCIVGGYCLPNSRIQLDIAGKDLTEYLRWILTERGYTFSSKHVKIIKEKVTYIALDYQYELNIASTTKDIEMKYELNDGSEIIINNERFKCPELLFQPVFMGKSHENNLPNAILQSIQLCDSNLHMKLLSNIILTGGNTLFPNIEIRLMHEIKELLHRNTTDTTTTGTTTAAPATSGAITTTPTPLTNTTTTATSTTNTTTTAAAVNVIAAPNRQYAAWLGSKLLLSQPDFPSQWILNPQADI